MDRDGLLEVCNYRIMYKEAWQENVGFIERGEEAFPLSADMTGCLDVLSFIGEPFPSPLSVLAMSVRDPVLGQEAYRFGLELAANKIACTMGLSSQDVSIGFREGFLAGGGRLELFLHKGMLDALDRPRLRHFLSTILVASGVVYSPFVPRLSLQGRLRGAIMLRDYMTTRKRAIVLLGLDKAAMGFVEEALMSGSEVYVHTSFLSSHCARMLAKEGANLITSACQLPPQLGRTEEALAYPDLRGNFHYGRRSYRLFRFS